MNKTRALFLIAGVGAIVTSALAVSNVINVGGTNVINNTAPPGAVWEPSSAWGGGMTASSFMLNGVTYLTVATGGVWGGTVAVIPASGAQLGDVALAWDPLRTRFVFTAIDLPASGNSNVWYGFSNTTGTSWTISPVPVFSASLNDWDYPSIAVDAGGRVMIGAVKFPQPGYYTALSTNGSTFSAPAFAFGAGSAPGGYSRIAATTSTFHAFVPTLNAGGQPIQVSRWESTNGTTWAGPQLLLTFVAPLVNSPTANPVFYAPFLQPSGQPSNNLWSVVFQINNGGYNNAFICTSNRGCGLVNAAADDEFLVAPSIDATGGYWVHYYAWSTLVTRQDPLITQAIYFPAGASAIGTNVNTFVQYGNWILYPPGTRCPVACRAAGDYNHISSGTGMNASAQHTTDNALGATWLIQNFLQDPPGELPKGAFTPNYISFPVGSDLRYLGVERTKEETVGGGPYVKRAHPRANGVIK